MNWLTAQAALAGLIIPPTHDTILDTIAMLRRQMHPVGPRRTPGGWLHFGHPRVAQLPETYLFTGTRIRVTQEFATGPIPPCEATAAPEVIRDE